MKLLVTGALGNVGRAVIDEAFSRDYKVIAYDLKNKTNKKRAKKVKAFVEKIVFGDIRDENEFNKSIQNCDCIIHLAAVVPPSSEENRDKCRDININGTMNVISAVNSLSEKIPIVYVSSSSVMGPTQEQKPPVNTSQIPNPVSHYAVSKLEAENLVTESGLKHCILRLASVMDSDTDYSDDMLKLLFEFYLDGRNEIIMDSDAAIAIVGAAEKLTDGNAINGKTYFIGGGRKNNCQITNREMISAMFDAMGIGMLSEKCFIDNSSDYSMDWYDTEESNEILNYQKHSFDDYLEKLRKKTDSGGPIVRYMAPKLRSAMELQSPYFKSNKEKK